MRAYQPAQRSNNNHRRLPWSKDWLIKLISIFFAIFLWYFVAGEDRVDMNVKIPVEIVNLPRDLVISNQFKDILDVTVSGPRSIIREISQQQISRSIDLSHATPGNIVIDNKNDSMSFPRGITVLRVQPSHIILLLDKLVQKNLPIRYVTMGATAKGYELAGIALSPDKLTISGPQTLIAKEADIPTRAIDLTGMSHAVSRQVLLQIPPELADLVGDPSVTAHIKIKKKIVEKEIGKIPIVVKGLTGKQQARLETKIIKLKVRMPLLMSNKYKNLQKLFHAEVDASVGPGRHNLKIKVSSEPGIFIEEIAPSTVSTIIK